ncbi:MAG TPA: carbohydrate-binding protein, partial [Fibrobacteraceae bacterium]|nr:carbohydrate-binding protein [Fibrobacteraceae bacterium]
AGEMREDGCCKSFSTNQVQRITQVMENAWPVSSTGLGSANDNYHFNRDGYIEFGKRYAKVMLEHMNRVSLPPSPHTAYKNVVAEIPGKLEAENYDEPGVGTIGKSYMDNDSENKSLAYRQDGVDIEELKDEPGSYVIGYTEKGEWLKYTVKVNESSNYNVTARVASAAKGSSFHLELDDKLVSDTILVDSIGDWSDYKEIKFNTEIMNAGEHVLKLVIDGSYVNIDWLDFVACGSSCDDNTAIRNHLHLGSAQPATYKIFDLNGNFLGVSDSPKLDLQKGISLRKGIYMLKGKDRTFLVKN